MKMYRMVLLFLLLIGLLIPAVAEEGSSSSPFSLDPWTDGLLLGSGLLLNGTYLLSNALAEDASYTHDGPLNRDSVNVLDRSFMKPFSQPLDSLSTVIAYATLLSPAVLVASPRGDWFTIGVMYAESLMLTWGLKELGKSFIPRYRPYMYFDDYPAEDVSNGEFRQSFPSGHTALAFTGAGFSTYVFSRYFPSSPWKIPVIAASYGLALSSATLRIASGSHFLTDVVSGAVLGSLSGFLVPWLHTQGVGKGFDSVGETRKLSFTIVPQGIKLNYRL